MAVQITIENIILFHCVGCSGMSVGLFVATQSQGNKGACKQLNLKETRTGSMHVEQKENKTRPTSYFKGTFSFSSKSHPESLIPE